MIQTSGRKGKIAITVVAIVLLAIAVAVRINFPKPMKLLDSSFDLSQIADGTYSGYCDNGLVKAGVKVWVQHNTITKVELVEHQNGLGFGAETIVDAVVEQQSIEVDTISGATASSQTILKAIENALSEGQETS